MEENKIRSRYEAAQQDHVFAFFNDLTDTEKITLLEQLDGIEVENLASLLQTAFEDQKKVSDESDIGPFSREVPFAQDATSDVITQSTKLGMEAISNGEVAALVLAGGQGTRLGFSGPKGMYDIGLPSGSTLFELIARRISKLKGPSGSSLPFYIMTSPVNHQETVSFFKENDFFGLPEADVIFFEQGMLPCMTNEGKIIMEAPGKVAMAPDGNGGIYPSLLKSGTLSDMAKRGVKYLHVFSIDNALVKPADPVFVGYCICQGADCGNKVLWKASAHEKVGVVAEKGGKPCIVEYSDISTEMAERTDGDGRLVFGAANICNHFYTIDFISDTILPNLGNLYHIARKKIPFFDPEKRETVKPESNNGIKLESFIFDVFPFSERMAVLDSERAQEFAPVKNAPGSPSDSPDTARSMISAMFQNWVEEAGGTLTGDLDATCEISPLTSYAGEGLSDLVEGKEIECPFQL